MRYLVKAKVKSGKQKSLLQAIESGTLGKGSIAGDEYLDNMQNARVDEQGICTWVEVCFCKTPLQEEHPYWKSFLNCSRLKMRTPERIAVTKMERSRGRVAIAIARESWRSIWEGRVSIFYIR